MKKGYEQHFDKLKKTNKIKPGPSAKSARPTSAEEYLRQALESRAANKKTKQKVPWTAVSIIVGGLCLATLGFFYPEKFAQVWGRFELTAFGLAEAAGEAENNSPSKKPTMANSAETTPSTSPTVCPEPKGFTGEELSHFNKLNDRKKELDQREAELTALEEELHKQKKEIEERISKLETIRQDVASVLKERVEVDEQRVATLVDFYSNMKPKQAAEIMASLNEDLAVEVLGKMKKKNAADILNLLEPAKARAISEKFTGYKRR